MSRKRRKARPVPISAETQREIDNEKRIVPIVDGVVARFRRRGLPSFVEPKDLRQDGLLKAYETILRTPEASNALIARCVRNRLVDVVRRKLADRPVNQCATADERKKNTGISRLLGYWDENGIWTEEPVWSDPFFLLTIESLETRHRLWEEDRKRWPADVDRRAKRWRRALMNCPVGNPPREAA